jgi:drug/metabolite transporter (DMT)-like permease
MSSRALGIVLILLNQLLNAGSGELMQFQESAAGPAASYNKPIFNIWFNHGFTGAMSGLVAVVILWRSAVRAAAASPSKTIVISFWSWGQQRSRVEDCMRAAGYSAAPLPSLARIRSDSQRGLFFSGGRAFGICSRFWCCRPCSPAPSSSRYLATRRAFADALLLVFVYKFNIFWALAVPHTAISVFMAIFQSGCVVTFALSVLVLGERCTAAKCAAVAVCLGGVFMVSNATAGDDGDGTTTVTGLAWTAACALGAAVYSVMWRLTPPGIGGGGGGEEASASTDGEGGNTDTKAVALLEPGPNSTGAVGPTSGGSDGSPATEHSAVWLFLGLMGAANCLLLWPMLWLGDAAGWEPFVLPAGWVQWRLVLSNGLLAWLSNVTLMLGITLTTPLIVAVGSVLQLPFSAVFDTVLHGIDPATLQLGGYALIMVGFGLMSKLRASPTSPPEV